MGPYHEVAIGETNEEWGVDYPALAFAIPNAQDVDNGFAKDVIQGAVMGSSERVGQNESALGIIGCG